MLAKTTERTYSLEGVFVPVISLKHFVWVSDQLVYILHIEFDHLNTTRSDYNTVYPTLEPY
jgi:hypothetical protein